MAIEIVDVPIENGDFPWLCNKLPEGKSSIRSHSITIFLWFSYGFPIVFLWFSYGFPMVQVLGLITTLQGLGRLPLTAQMQTEGFSGFIHVPYVIDAMCMYVYTVHVYIYIYVHTYVCI